MMQMRHSLEIHGTGQESRRSARRGSLSRALVWLPLLLLAAGSAPVAAAPGGFTYPGAKAPNLDADWRTPFGWEAQGEGFRCRAGTRADVFLKEAPFGNAVTVEAALRLTNPLGQSWNVAGVTVYLDPDHYWQLALVEAPGEGDRRRFVELGERREGRWPAQGADKLPAVTFPEGTDLSWEYGRPYRLRLELDPKGVTASVLDAAGACRWKRGYRFEGAAVTQGRPGLVASGFAAEFSGMRAAVAQVVEGPKAKPIPAYAVKAPATPVRGKATGFFRVEQRDGRFWVIDPQGNGFYAVGTDHCTSRGHWCEALGYAPHQRITQEKYGTEEAWAAAATGRLKAWGFNLLGAGCAPSARYQGLAHTLFMSAGQPFARLGEDYRIAWPEDDKPKPCSVFPNVFHPKFAEFCRKRAEELCESAANDPWLFGYFLDNELAWWGQARGKGASLFATVMGKEAAHPAKQALVAWLRERYGSIEALNRAWGSEVPSFERLAAMDAATGRNEERLEKDRLDFAALCADRYFAATTGAIRAVDPNHLILGCRFAGIVNAAYDPIWAACGKYCDIVTVNVYGKVDLQTGETYEMVSGKRVPLPELLAETHRKTGRKPLMITEWSFPSYDSGLPCKHGAGQRVSTQAERTFAFTAYQKMLFGLPFFVGSDFFMWVDEPALGIAAHFPEDSNYGLISEKDEPYQLLTEACARLNPRVGDIHAGRTAELSVRAGKRGEFIVANTGTVGAEVKVTLWTDGTARTSSLSVPAGRRQRVVADAASLRKRGGRYLRCAVEPAGDTSEVNAADNAADQVLYTPGMKAPVATQRRVPLVVANPEATPRSAMPLVVPAATLAKLDWKARAGKVAVFDVTDGATPLPCQLDLLPEGAELAVLAPAIRPYSARTLMVCIGTGGAAGPTEPAVTYRRTAEGYEVDNGRLSLSRSKPGGDVFDRVALDGVELGRLYPLMRQDQSQSLWVPPDRLDSVEAWNGPVRLVLDVTLSRGASAGEVKPRVDAAGVPEPVKAQAAAYKTRYRITVLPGATTFASRLLWVENTDARPWRLASYFHYAPSNIAGKREDDQALGTCWFDPGAGLFYGAIDAERAFSVSFRTNPAGGQHPDAYRQTEVTLKPGARFAEPQPALTLGAAKGAAPEAWSEFTRSVTAAGSARWKAFGAEQ